MSKLRDISDAIVTRMAQITIANGYSNDIGNRIIRGQAQINADEVPASRIYMEQRTARETDPVGNAICDAVIVVEGYVKREADAETQGIQILGDIQRAVEPGDKTLGGLLDPSGMKFIGDEVLYPENSDSVVGGRVEYSIPHLRKPGDPENA